jgi:hypothetical protein
LSLKKGSRIFKQSAPVKKLQVKFMITESPKEQKPFVELADRLDALQKEKIAAVAFRVFRL